MGNLCGTGRLEYHRIPDSRISEGTNLRPEEHRVIAWENDLDFQHIYFDQFELQI